MPVVFVRSIGIEITRNGNKDLHLSFENVWWDICDMHAHSTDSFDDI